MRLGTSTGINKRGDIRTQSPQSNLGHSVDGRKLHSTQRKFSVSSRIDAGVTSSSRVRNPRKDFRILGSFSKDRVYWGWFNRLGLHGQSQAPQVTRGKPRVVKGHPKFAEYLGNLRNSTNSQDKYVLKLIDDTIDLLSQSRTLGNPVPRDRWPKDYLKFPDRLPCLLKINLDDNYRMTYSLIKTPTEPLFAYIIEVMTHPEYNRRFGYD